MLPIRSMSFHTPATAGKTTAVKPYTHTYTNIHIHAHTYIHAHTRTHKYTHTYTHSQSMYDKHTEHGIAHVTMEPAVDTYTPHIHTHTHTKNTPPCSHTHTHTHIYTYIYIRMHTYIHIQTSTHGYLRPSALATGRQRSPFRCAVSRSRRAASARARGATPAPHARTDGARRTRCTRGSPSVRWH